LVPSVAATATVEVHAAATTSAMVSVVVALVKVALRIVVVVPATTASALTRREMVPTATRVMIIVPVLVVALTTASATRAILVIVMVVAATASVVLPLVVVVVMIIVVVVVVVPVAVAVTVTVMVVIVVGAVRLEPVQLVLLVLQQERLVALFLRHLGEDIDNLDEAEGVECGVVLLRETQGAPLPVGHLLPLAHLQIQQVLRHLGQAALIRSNAHFAEVGLRIDEVREQFVELHGREMSGKNIQVAFEREANAEGFLVREDLGQDVVEERIGGERYQIDQICRIFIT
jgi:hypothetical protein